MSNELIWASRTFRSNGVYGIRPMADGKHYTSLVDETGSGSAIVRYAYATGLAVDTVASSRTVFGDAEMAIEEYTFSDDESKILKVYSTRHR